MAVTLYNHNIMNILVDYHSSNQMLVMQTKSGSAPESDAFIRLWPNDKTNLTLKYHLNHSEGLK